MLLCTISVATWFRHGLPAQGPVEAPKLKIKRLSLYVSDRRLASRPFGKTELPTGTIVCLTLYDADDHGVLGQMTVDYSAGPATGVIDDRLEVNLTPPNWNSLTEKLSKLKGWRTEQYNDGTPQDQVLYTRLEMDTNQGQFVSNWRGFPPEQKLVMETLLGASFGPDLRRRLLKLSDPKAPLTIPF
jgi:hypothetical protein